ncbi:MAG: VWA domain-containing protein [Phycisphaera sp.]|nr:VWA domain-containing protein [Phycisphaera sp.]
MSSPAQSSKLDSKGKSALAARIEALEAERRSLLRQRRIHLALLAVAVSLPVHIAIMIWLYFSEVELPPGPPAPTPIVLDLSVLPDEALTEMLEPLETEDVLTPELNADAGEESLVLEASESMELPKLDLDSATSGLDTNLGTEGEGLGTGLGSGAGAGAEFFGIRARGNRFAYVVDISGSMGQNGRFELALGELIRSLAALPDYAEFKIALYSNGVVSPNIQKTWLRASPGTVNSIRTWVDNYVRPGGGTEPLPAFEYLFRTDDLPPDTIFFLTDGIIPAEIEEQVIFLNESSRRRPAVVNTIAFSADASQKVLRNIASRTDGVFRFVPEGTRRP